MFFNKKILFVTALILIQSMFETICFGGLMVLGKATTGLAVRSAGTTFASTAGAALFVSACHYSSLKEFTDDVGTTSSQIIQTTKQNYEKLRSKFSEKFGNAEFVDKKIEQNGGDNKAWLGGKAGDINHITNNYFGKRSFADLFFEWLEKGKQTRAVAVGFTAGVVGTSGVHYMLRSKFGSDVTEPKPQVIFVQVPTAPSA